MSSTSTGNPFLPAIFSSRRKQELVLAILAVAVYLITLSNGFAFDDSIAIQKNPLVKKGVAGIGELLSTPYQYGYAQAEKVAAYPLYRPLSLVLFAIEYEIGGDSPFPGHLVNILLYACCVVLLFRFITRLFAGQEVVAFTACVLFAVHPVHTEVVANIKSSDELLCFFFSFLALNKMLDYAQNGKVASWLMGGLFYFMAILSKETAVTFLGVIPLIFFFYSGENRKRSVILTITALSVVVICLAIRSSVFTAYDQNEYRISLLDNSLVAAPSVASRFATAFLILGNYLRLLFIPYPLYHDYSFNAIPYAQFSDVVVVLSVIAYAVIGGYGVWCLTRKRKDMLAFGILFFLITISLFSNLFFIRGANMAERFLFLPSVGFCIAIALAITQLPLLKEKIWLLLVPITVLFSALTIMRSAEWKDNLTLFRADAKKSSGSWRIYYGYGVALFQDLIDKHMDESPPRAVLEEATRALERSVAIYPDYELTQERLATAFLADSMYDSAEVHLKKVVQLNPGNEEAVKKLTMIYFGYNQFREALETYRSFLAGKHDEPDYGFIGTCYMKLEKYDSASTALRVAYQLQPDNEILKNLVFSFSRLGNQDSVAKYQAMMK